MGYVPDTVSRVRMGFYITPCRKKIRAGFVVRRLYNTCSAVPVLFKQNNPRQRLVYTPWASAWGDWYRCPVDSHPAVQDKETEHLE